jgi:hypothetical protein
VSNARHHLKAYIVFLFLSILLVGVLAYLYTPFNIKVPQKLTSQSLDISGEVFISSEPLVIEWIDANSVAAKRIRLTNLLLRYQKELVDIETRTKTPSLDEKARIDFLRNKIENLQKMITELSQ